jgi:hypothetical protein
MAIEYALRTSTKALAVSLEDKGKATYVNMCQAWVCTRLFGTGAVGDYDKDGAADAQDGWKKAKALGKVVLAKDIKNLKDIPAGVVAFWEGGSHGYGHTAITLGGGKIRTTGITNNPKVSDRDLTYITNTWKNGLKFIGYATVVVNAKGQAYNIQDKPATLPPLIPEAVTYEITASVLNGRVGPGTDYTIGKTANSGAKITSVGYSVAKDGSIWAKNIENLFWSKSYLQVKNPPANVITPDSTIYEVTAKPSLRGRSGPGTSFATVTTASTGTKINAKNSVKLPTNEVWIQDTKNNYYSKDYLKVHTSSDKFELLLADWNLKSPTLKIEPAGAWPTWETRRPKQIAYIKQWIPHVLLLQEAGSPANVDWYDLQLKTLGLTNVEAYMKDADGKPTGKWRVIYYDENIFTKVTSGLYTIKPKLDGDDKQMAECVLRHNVTGEPYYFGSFHLENQKGTKYDNLRVDQMADCFERRATAANTHNVAPEHCFMGGDTNSEKMVAKWVKDNTEYIDGALRAKTAYNIDLGSINRWKKPVKEDRQDYFWIHESLEPTSFDNVDTHDASDHDEQRIRIPV